MPKAKRPAPVRVRPPRGYSASNPPTMVEGDVALVLDYRGDRDPVEHGAHRCYARVIDVVADGWRVTVAFTSGVPLLFEWDGAAFYADGQHTRCLARAPEAVR